jgi:hypothetical protein
MLALLRHHQERGEAMRRYVGRLFWDPDHPSPWVEFGSQRDFEVWRADIRRALPGTQTELNLVGATHTAASLLHIAKHTKRNTDRNEAKRMDPQDGTNEGYDLPVGTRPKSKRDQLEARLERHRREAARFEQQLALLDELPEEPEVEDDEPNVIWFTKVFQNGSRTYIYGACKADDGLWYTTGPNTPKGFTWDRLIEWIYDGKEAEVWHAVAYESLS